MKRIGYAIATVILLLIEVLIAIYVHDAFVRPYIGDVLVTAVCIYFCGTGRGFADVPYCGSIRLAEKSFLKYSGRFRI